MICILRRNRTKNIRQKSTFLWRWRWVLTCKPCLTSFLIVLIKTRFSSYESSVNSLRLGFLIGQEKLFISDLLGTEDIYPSGIPRQRDISIFDWWHQYRIRCFECHETSVNTLFLKHFLFALTTFSLCCSYLPPLVGFEWEKNTYDDFATVRVCINGDLRMRMLKWCDVFVTKWSRFSTTFI